MLNLPLSFPIFLIIFFLLCLEGDDTQKERQERQMERTRKRALSSSIMQDLRQEYDDGPEEMRVSVRVADWGEVRE